MASPDTSPYFTGYNKGPGLSSVGSYQIAGTPWLSGSTLPVNGILEIKLPAVSRHIAIYNMNEDTAILSVTFRDPDDVGVTTLGHQFKIYDVTTVAGATAYPGKLEMETKCTSFWLENLSGAQTLDWQAHVELTGIAPDQMFELSGSGINDV